MDNSKLDSFKHHKAKHAHQLTKHFTMCMRLQMSRLPPTHAAYTLCSKIACSTQNPIRQQSYQVCGLGSWYLVCFGFLGSLGLLGHGGQISLHLGHSVLVSIGQLLYHARTHLFGILFFVNCHFLVMLKDGKNNMV